MVDLELLKRFDKSKWFKSVDELDEFLYIISLIGETDDPEYLPYLFSCISDKPRYQGVHYWLSLVIMGYAPEDLIMHLLLTIKDYYSRIPIYVCELFMRFLDIPEYLQILKNNICITDKKTLLRILNDIKKNADKRHLNVANELQKFVCEKCIR